MGEPADVVQLQEGCCSRCTGYSDYVRLCADLMGLRDWEVQVEHGEPWRGNLCEVRTAPMRKIARIRVSVMLDDLEPDERRHAIAHELVHPLTRDLIESVIEGARPEFGETAFRVFVGNVDREHERMVDVLASVIEAVLPLP